MIKIAVTPEVNAISTLLMVLTLCLIVLVSKVSPGALRAGDGPHRCFTIAVLFLTASPPGKRPRR